MKKQRILYFNDARHYYLFVHEPPMSLEEAWRPIDEIAGTSVNTFVYGVERGDGLFYPSRAGRMFEGSMLETGGHEFTYEWRTVKNMQGLIDRGLDPLTVLIDRAHDKGMEFIASLRMHSYLGLKDEHRVPTAEPWASNPSIAGSGLLFNGADHSHKEVREHNLAVAGELARDYATDGVELDFIFTAHSFPREEARDKLDVMTNLVEKISETVRGRPGSPGILGARVLPTEEMCLNAGQDVRNWLDKGLLDYVLPMTYDPFRLDCDPPIEWLVEAAQDTDTSVYGFLHPYYQSEGVRRFIEVQHATPAMVRAAAANNYRKGVDGLCAWFLKWPLGDDQRGLLTQIGDPDLLEESDKHYFLRWRSDTMATVGWDGQVPQPIGVGEKSSFTFEIADDPIGNARRIRQLLLRIKLDNSARDDQITYTLNGDSLNEEQVVSSYGDQIAPYQARWLEFRLRKVTPRQGLNELTISLEGRPDGLSGSITVEDVELLVEYTPYPTEV